MTPTKPLTSQPSSSWEVFLLGELNKLRDENAALKEQLNKVETRLATLEGKPDPVHEVQEQIQEAKKEYIVATEGMQKQLTRKVISTIKEEELQESVARSTRVGGLPEGWDKQEVRTQTEVEEVHYILEIEIMKRRISRVLPSVNIGDPYCITPKGSHAIMDYYDKKDKIKILRQSKLLQGTKLWLADELTPTQLKNKSAELAKVRAARQAGKWAVYRQGRAVIEDFRKPKPID